MTTTSQIPASIRETFQRFTVADEHCDLFRQPTGPLLEIDGATRINALRQSAGDTGVSIDLQPACRFMMEAQLEALEETLTQISERHPERFRETERGLALIRNLEILLDDAQAAG